MSLSSLIVQREVATMRQVEEALARQVIYGGDLVTNLLEVAHVDEAILVGLLAESMRLAPAPSGQLPDASDRVKALVSRELAIERAVTPLDLQSDGKLILAVTEPLSQEVEAQLRSALGMAIEQRAAPAVRVQQAISRTYGAPLDRRMMRLITRLSGEAVDAGSLPPRDPTAAGQASLPSSSFAAAQTRAGSPSWAPAAVVGRLAPKQPGHRKTSTNFPAVRSSSASALPAASVSSPSVTVRAERVSLRAGLLQRDAVAGARVGRRRRGPITVEKANEEAEHAEDRDALLDLFFDFCQQFFDYSALFLVHGDIAEGRDAFGMGATRDRVLGIGVPLDMPSMMSAAREQRVPIVSKASIDGLDAVLLTDLQRSRDAELAIVPVVVRTRAVAILIGDCGDAGVERASVQQVVGFSVVVGKAFERIIVQRKLSGAIAGIGEDRASKLAGPPAGAAGAKNGPEPPAISSPPVPFVSKLPKRAPSSRPPASASTLATSSALASNLAASSLSASLPPPSANVAAVRRISGPPIPREEPDTPSVTTESERRAPLAARVSSPGPQLEIVDIETGDVDPGGPFAETHWSVARGARGAPAAPPASDPPASESIVVSAHKPPAPEPAAIELPSVIVDDDLDRELGAIVARLAAGEVDEHAEGELLRHGARAVRALMSRFPGPVTFPRDRIATALNPPRASECGPILRLVARERRVALPFVAERLASSDVEIRGWATHLICELPYVEAIAPLLPRLRDSDVSTRVSATHALAAIARNALQPVKKAIDGLAHEASPDDRIAALMAMAHLREGSFVPELVHALGDDDDRVTDAAHEALVQLTRQDLGTDARRWMRWWEQNADRHRVEWLIDALTHEVAEIRKTAGEELRKVTKEYLGYASDLPARDRDRAQQRYRDWWVMEGQARFRQP